LTSFGAVQEYFAGNWFRTKLELLAVALVFQGTAFRWMMNREPERTNRGLRILTGIVGTLLWLSVAFSGRAIAFF
jgi:hypothetical protein